MKRLLLFFCAALSILACTKPENRDNPSDVAVSSVALDRETLDLSEGETAILKANVLPANAADKSVSWSSSNPAAARPANGKPVIHQQGCAWAYKKNATTGRVIPLGSHPEGIDEGERRDLMASILLYAIDGNGEAKSKANLSNGTTRKQTNPSSTTLAGIGDGQYHHFKVSIPAGAKNFKLEIASELADYDLHLSMRKGDLAWRSEADFCLTQKGSTKTLELDSIEEGEWYVSVYCATLPTSKLTDTKGCKYYAYEGLNAGIKGVPYTIKASWE